MMTTNINSFRTSNEYYSRAMQHRAEKMLHDANTLFSLGWLRKQLWRELKGITRVIEPTEYRNYSYVLQGDNEKKFMWQFLSVCLKSVEEVKKVIDNAYDTQAPIMELVEERDELIRDFASMPLSRSWENVKKDAQSWRNFANRLPYDDPGRKEEIANFFEVLDHISVITDIICKRADEYELEVDYSAIEDYDNEKKSKELTDEILVRAIESVSHLMNSQSAWAAIFCVLRDDFGYSNQSAFERKIKELKFKKNMYPCPKDTISSTFSNNDYMVKLIDKWPEEKKFFKLADAFRQKLTEELA